MEACIDLEGPFSLQQKLVGGLYIFLESIFLMAVRVEGLWEFMETVLSTVELVARFWRFVESVWTTQKSVEVRGLRFDHPKACRGS